MNIEKYLEIEKISLDQKINEYNHISAKQLAEILWFGTMYLEHINKHIKNEVKMLRKVFSSRKKSDLLRSYANTLCIEMVKYIRHLKKDEQIHATQTQNRSKYLNLRIEKGHFSVQSLQEYFKEIQAQNLKKEKMTKEEVEKLIGFVELITFDLCNRLERGPLRNEDIKDTN